MAGRLSISLVALPLIYIPSTLKRCRQVEELHDDVPPNLQKFTPNGNIRCKHHRANRLQRRWKSKDLGIKQNTPLDCVGEPEDSTAGGITWLESIRLLWLAGCSMRDPAIQLLRGSHRERKMCDNRPWRRLTSQHRHIPHTDSRTRLLKAGRLMIVCRRWCIL